MKKIVYYPCCQEIFDIYEADGISYYYIDKNEHKIKTIINKSNIFKVFNSSTDRQINDYWTLYNNVISIIKKCRNDNNKFHFDKYTNNNGIYEVYSANKVGWSSFYTLKEYQKIIGVSIYSYLVDTSNNEECPSADSVVSFRSNNKDECISFGSYIRTKLVRFLISINLLGLTGVIKDEWWRFVPDPANWNLLYEDKPLPNYTPDPETGEYDAIHHDKDNNPVTIRHCSLYIKYHLTDDEINIIESVIKERK